MISLEDEVKKCDEIQLEVAFFTCKYESSFDFDGVRYYPMCRNVYNINEGINRIRERVVSQAKKDSITLHIMLDVIKRSTPDLIHIHGTESSFGLIADYVKDIPIVYSIQGLLAPYSEKYFSGMPDKEIYSLESIRDKLHFVSYRDVYKDFCYRAEREKRFLSQAQYVIGRTFWDEYITGLFNPDRKYFLVDEILRSPFYTVQWHHKKNGRYQIISTISGGIYKGYEVVLKTALLLQSYSRVDFEWTIAGYDAESKYVKIAEKLTSIKSKNVNIIFKGRVNADELSELLENSDLYVHVSHIENSPNSVCEAMLVGLPIIATYAGGTGSLLQNEKEGILVQDGDPYILAGAIMMMKLNPEKAAFLGANARKRALARHSAERILEQLVTAYNKILLDFRK